MHIFCSTSKVHIVHPNSSYTKDRNQIQTLPRLRTSTVSEHWLSNIFKSSATVLAASLILLSSSPANARETLVGIPRIIDGDTLEVSKTRVRLFGLDAPEIKQQCSKTFTKSDATQYNCGELSKTALERKIANQTIACDVKRKDIYGRSVAICSFAVPNKNGVSEDINEWLVKEGYATAYRRYSTKYIAAEDEAKQAGKGLWAGGFEEPEAWRREHPRGSGGSVRNNSPSLSRSNSVNGVPSKETIPSLDVGEGVQSVVDTSIPKSKVAAKPLLKKTSEKPVPCLIKGNITAKGQRIYHVPGGRSYEVTKIEVEKGERYFCNEDEAVDPGWRKAN